MIKYFMISLIGIIVFMNGYCIKKGNIEASSTSVGRH